MIQMHCDRCYKGEKVRWTEGKERGEPMMPEHWGRVAVPTMSATPEVYVLCADCLAALHS